jgi:hypothetical protein
LITELKLKPNTEEKISPPSDETVRLELSLTKAQFEKLQTIKNLVSHQIPDLNTGKVLEMLCDFFISKKAKTMDTKTTETREVEETAIMAVQTKAIKTMTQEPAMRSLQIFTYPRIFKRTDVN